MSKLNEKEQIEKAKRNRADFAPLYEYYFETIFRFVFKRLGGDESTAGDITQQTFIKAMTHIGSYEDKGFPFSSWLYRIAQNEVLMYFRKSSKHHEVEISENSLRNLYDEIEKSPSMKQSELERLVEVLNGLAEEHKDLIELRFFQSFSFKEIAELYNITEANAKMRVYRILEKMQKAWKS